jgi:hypothetical protein
MGLMIVEYLTLKHAHGFGANNGAQRCAAEGAGLQPRRDRRIRWSKS